MAHSREFASLTTHSQGSAVLTTDSLTAHFIGETSGFITGKNTTVGKSCYKTSRSNQSLLFATLIRPNGEEVPMMLLIGGGKGEIIPSRHQFDDERGVIPSDT